VTAADLQTEKPDMIIRLRLLPLLCGLVVTTQGQRGKLIQTLVDQLRSGPKYDSISPSFNGIRKFDVIGSGSLPLQSDRQQQPPNRTPSQNTPSIGDVISGNLARFETNNRDNFSSLDSNRHENILIGPDVSPQGTRKGRPSGVRVRPRFRQPNGRKIKNKPKQVRDRRNNIPQQVGDRRNNIPKHVGDRRNNIPQQKRKETKVKSSMEKNKFENNIYDNLPPNNIRGPNRRPGRDQRKSLMPSPFDMFKQSPVNLRRPGIQNMNKSQNPRNGQRRRKNNQFHPPRATFDGFRPSFQSSSPFDENIMSTGEQKRRKRKPNKKYKKPTKDNKLNLIKQKKFDVTSGFQEEPADELKPYYFSNKPFDDGFSKSGSETSKINSLISEELPDFGPEIQTVSSGPKKRLRSKNTKKQSSDIGTNNLFSENIFNDEPGDGKDFFQNAQETFPDFDDFGMGWEAKKIRRKRSALNNPFYYSNSDRKTNRLVTSDRRPRRGPRRPSPPTNRRQGPAGFWDDPEFDSDFFSGRPPAYSNFEAFTPQTNQPYTPQGDRGYRQTDRRPPQITSKKFEQTSYSPVSNNNPYEFESKPNSYQTSNRYQPIVDNSLLGSGNFDVLKGGTFYDDDEHPSFYRNKYQTQEDYYADKNIFNNFRDFADIKGEKKRLQEVFYYK